MGIFGGFRFSLTTNVSNHILYLAPLSGYVRQMK